MPIYAPSVVGGALRQGELLSNVVEARIDFETLRQAQDELALEEKVHPLAVVLTQDCDLDWDHTARIETDPERKAKLANKALPNILLCEVWFSTDLRGEQGLNNTLWRRIQSNSDERYHILPPVAPEHDLLRARLEELAIDFKRVFTVRTEELYFRLTTEAQRRCCLEGLFKQDLSTRFGCYQIRVALPADAPPLAAPTDAPTQETVG